MKNKLEVVKNQILIALAHQEAEEGLYFRNFANLHEEDERDPVEGDEVAILDALSELMREGKVVADESGDEIIFALAKSGTSARQ
jgi:hypothetical protein